MSKRSNKLNFTDSMSKEEKEYRRQQFLKQTPRCPICGDEILSPFRFFCSWECAGAYRRENDRID